MSKLTITLPELKKYSDEIRKYNVELDDILSNCLSSMNELSSVWESLGAETIIERFKKFSNRFTLESDCIEEYAKFLDLTADSYDVLNK